MAALDVAAHAVQVGPAAAADVEDIFVALPAEEGESPGRELGVALVHAREHLFPGFSCRLCRIARRRDLFLLHHLILCHVCSSFRPVSSEFVSICLFSLL